MKKHYILLSSMVPMLLITTLLLASDWNDKNLPPMGLLISNSNEKEIIVAGSYASGAFKVRDCGYQSWGSINVNTATVDQLDRLLGPLNIMNRALAQAIVDYRNEKGPYKSLDDLINVKGMNRTKMDDLKPWLVLEGKTNYRGLW